MSNGTYITPAVGEFSDSYSSQSLGQISLDTGENIASGYGGIAFLDSDTLLVTGNPYSPEATIYEVDLLRDPDTNSITGFAAPATFVANAPGIGSLDSDPEANVGGLDGGLIVAPNGTLLYTTWSDNSIGQILPGSTSPDEFIDLTALGIDPPSVGALTIVPDEFPGEGRLKITSFGNGNFYDALLAPDDDGTYDITVEGNVDLTPADDSFRGLEGIVYVDESYSDFTTDSVLLVEYSANNISTFEVDELGNPIPETERTFVEDFSQSGSLYASTVDPVTGDLLFTVDGGDSLSSQILLLKDEVPPIATPDNNPFDDVTELDISSGAATANGAVSTGNDVYTIDARAGDLLTIDINVTEVLPGIAFTNDDTELYLYNEAGDVLAFSQDKSDSLASRVLNYLVPENETYYVAVTTAGNEPILELGEVNQLLGFEQTGLANVVYDITASTSDVPDTARLFDISRASEPDNPVGDILIDGDEVLFLDLNGSRNTDTFGALPVEVNQEDNSITLGDFPFVLEFEEPFASTDVEDIVDNLEESSITAIIPPDLLVEPIVFSEVEIPDSNFEPVFGSVDGDTIEVSGGNQLIFAGEMNDLVDASNGNRYNRIYAGSGDDTLILGESDRLVGGAGNDKFFAMSGGDNIITGGAGADQFWIATAEIPEAANIITDFTGGEDVLGIAGLGIGFDDLSITQQEDNTLIAANNSELALLQGVGMDMLNADSFAFV